MKKEYTKPIALIENFEMNEFIAGACTDAGKNIYKKPSGMNMNIDSCLYEDPENGETYFSQNCLSIDGGYNVFDDYETCYQGILGGNFAS